MDRVILHCDCNSFFASVETAHNPSYANVPMAVCGSTEERHGIVLAKNDKAKAYGIQTAETVYSAKRKCPNLVIASPHYDWYVDYSKRVNEIYNEYTDLVEPFGMDESWLDVTASRRIFGNGEEIAKQIKERVKKEMGITISVGVSFNKVFAKLGSDYKKPDAITVISRENYKAIVFPLPVSDLLFIGKKTAEQLSMLGIKTVGDLASVSPDFLKRRFGKQGEMMYDYANGLDTSPVINDYRDDTKSISNGFTFRHDLTTADECKLGIDFLCDEIGNKLRKKSIQCSTVSLTVKDVYLHTIQRQRSLVSPIDTAREISDVAYSILQLEWNFGEPIRMLAVSVSNFSDASSGFKQLDFFSDQDIYDDVKNRKREATVDLIREKFGQSSISTAAIIGSDIGVAKKAKKSVKIKK